MSNFIKAIIEFFSAFFGALKIEKNEEEKPEFQEISAIPKYGDQGRDVGVLQTALNKNGASLKVDEDFGPKTKEAVSAFQKSKGLNGSGIIGPKTLGFLYLKIKPVKMKRGIPWFWKLKEFDGSVETDQSFGAKISSYWKYVGLPGFKSIIGSKRAWCGVFIAAGLIMVGNNYQKDGAGAKNWDKYGVEINWRVDGIPQGAIVRINHGSNCSSASGNHVTLANGDCSAKDLLKAGAVFSGYGGNQGNMAKISNFPVNDICSVRWPDEVELPEKVVNSHNCSNGKTASGESTR